jgi:hypothetical protein
MYTYWIWLASLMITKLKFIVSNNDAHDVRGRVAECVSNIIGSALLRAGIVSLACLSRLLAQPCNGATLWQSLPEGMLVELSRDRLFQLIALIRER